jgi:hypothetical protein
MPVTPIIGAAWSRVKSIMDQFRGFGMCNAGSPLQAAEVAYSVAFERWKMMKVGQIGPVARPSGVSEAETLHVAESPFVARTARA